MYGLSFDKINVIIAFCEDIHGHRCIQKSKNDHFHRYRFQYYIDFARAKGEAHDNI